MSKKCVVVHASGTGFTRSAAQSMVDSLNRRGYECSILEASGSELSENYDLYVLGSPVILGKMPKRMKQWILANRNHLDTGRVYFFWTCLRLTEATDIEKLPFGILTDPAFTEEPMPFSEMNSMEKSHEINRYFNPLMKEFPWLDIVKGAVFKGGLDYGKLSIPAKIFMRFMSLLQKDQKEGNYVNEGEIRNWAELII